MEVNTKIAGILAVTVAVVVLCLTFPIFESTYDDMRGVKTYSNPEVISPYTEVKAGDHLYWTPSGITVNDVAIEGNRVNENWFKGETFLGASNSFFVYRNDDSVRHVDGLIYLDLVVNDDMSVTCTFENGNTIGNPQVYTTQPMKWGFIISNKGDWCQVRYDSPNRHIYFNSVEQIYTSGPGGGLVASKGTTASWKGTEYENGIVFTGITEIGQGVYSMDYSLTTVGYDVPGIDDDVRVLVVPIKITSVPEDTPASTLFMTLPLLIVVGLIVATVRLQINRV